MTPGIRLLYPALFSTPVRFSDDDTVILLLIELLLTYYNSLSSTLGNSPRKAAVAHSNIPYRT